METEDKSLVSLQISDDMIRPIIEKKISAGIITALGGEETLIEQAVTLALRQKVDQRGKTSQFRSDNKYDWLEIMTSNAIREAAKEAMAIWLAENSEKVRTAVLKEMKKPKRVNSIARAFADSVESSVQLGWNIKCNVDFAGRKEGS